MPSACWMDYKLHGKITIVRLHSTLCNESRTRSQGHKGVSQFEFSKYENVILYLPVVEVFEGSNSSLMECGEIVFSSGVLDPAGTGVATRSADSLLDLSVVVVVGGCGGVLQFLVKANA